MKKSKKNVSKHLRGSTTADDDRKVSTTTAVTFDSDDNASDTVTLVECFPDLAVGDVFEADDNDTSVESSTADPSSEVSSGDQSTPGADSNNNEAVFNDYGKKGKNQKQGKAPDTESESGVSAETSSADTRTSANESSSSKTSSAEVAMAESTTSGEASTYDGASSRSVEAATSRAQSSNAGNWTPSEDALIISMKKGGESWASIGNTINRGKNEVKKRWHVARANVANSTESVADNQTNKGHDGHKTEDRFKSRAERNAERKAEQKKNKGNSKPNDGTKDSKNSNPNPKEPSPRPDMQEPSEDSEAPSTPKTRSFNSIGDSPSSSLRNRLDLLRDTTSASSSLSSATSNGSNDGAGDSPNRCYKRELARQQRYIRRHVHPALYPPRLSIMMPPPDKIYPPSHADKRQRRDDALLASMASRREATKWLEMQANFYNVTGRMVPLYMIKTRCEAVENRGKVAGVQNWASSVAGGEELLDPNEGADAPEDALVDNDDEE